MISGKSLLLIIMINDKSLITFGTIYVVAVIGHVTPHGSSSINYLLPESLVFGFYSFLNQAHTGHSMHLVS